MKKRITVNIIKKFIENYMENPDVYITPTIADVAQRLSVVNLIVIYSGCNTLNGGPKIRKGLFA